MLDPKVISYAKLLRQRMWLYSFPVVEPKQLNIAWAKALSINCTVWQYL
jgi:hypothetical protein